MKSRKQFDVEDEWDVLFVRLMRALSLSVRLWADLFYGMVFHFMKTLI
jgi:hypothetical protein